MNINYLHAKEFGIELIISKCSVQSYPIHNHVSVFTIGLILEGSIELTVKNNTICYLSNDTFVIPPYVPHRITALGEYSLLSCCIHKNIVETVPMQVIGEMIELLLKAGVVCNDINNVQVDRILEVFCVLQKDSANIKLSQLYLSEIVEQLERYPEKQVYVDEMAKASFVSKYYFIRQFKEEIGLTPHQFLLQNRIRKAQHLLVTSDTITEVALATGFYDQSHFIRNFEKIVGLTPGAYKMSCAPISLKSLNQVNAGMNFANI